MDILQANNIPAQVALLNSPNRNPGESAANPEVTPSQTLDLTLNSASISMVSLASESVAVSLSPTAVAMENAAAMQSASPDVLANFMAELARQNLLGPVMNFSDGGSQVQTLLKDPVAVPSDPSSAESAGSAGSAGSLATVPLNGINAQGLAADLALSTREMMDTLNARFLTTSRGATSSLLSSASEASAEDDPLDERNISGKLRLMMQLVSKLSESLSGDGKDQLARLDRFVRQINNVLGEGQASADRGPGGPECGAAPEFAGRPGCVTRVYL